MSITVGGKLIRVSLHDSPLQVVMLHLMVYVEIVYFFQSNLKFSKEIWVLSGI
jgi:hypothetical protein